MPESVTQARFTTPASTSRHQFSLALRALPVAVLVVVARWVLHSWFDVSGIMSFGDAGAVITGATIIVGLMLAGVLADYKEAEKLPGTIAGCITGINTLATAALAVAGSEASWVRPRMGRIAEAVARWVRGEIDEAAMWAAQSDGIAVIVEAEKAGAPSHYVLRMLQLNGEMGGSLSRVEVIRRTTFVRAGYVLMQVLVFVVLFLLVISDFTSPVMRWIVPFVLAMAYMYLILLVKDVDNPFDGEVCVDLAPLDRAATSLSS